MESDEYHTISLPSEGMYKDSRSRFLSFAYPVCNEQSVKEHLHHVKKTHHECNHHCYAFRLNPDGMFFRCADDREPSGSAGRPILGQLLSHDLTDTLIIVGRYFGGSRLGVPGLINAYRSAAADAIENARIIVRTVNELLELAIPYTYINELMIILKSEPVLINSQNYGDPVILNITIRKSRKKSLIDKLNNKLAGFLHIK